MKLLGVIPARGGSKRLPGKNIRPLAGRPLLDWTVRTALDSGVLHDLVLSTDDEAIAQVGRASGAKVLSLRPSALSTDTATAASVLVHETRQWEQLHGMRLDGVMLLQPTSPFRSCATLRDAVAIFQREKGACTVVGVSPPASHPWWCMTLDGSGALAELHPGGLQLRSQELPPVYEVNGTVYLIPRDHLMASGTIYTERRVPVVVNDPSETVDIDTPLDWEIAQAVAANLKEKPHV